MLGPAVALTLGFSKLNPSVGVALAQGADDTSKGSPVELAVLTTLVRLKLFIIEL